MEEIKLLVVKTYDGQIKYVKPSAELHSYATPEEYVICRTQCEEFYLAKVLGILETIEDNIPTITGYINIDTTVERVDMKKELEYLDSLIKIERCNDNGR